jgi:hypothetical protein
VQQSWFPQQWVESQQLQLFVAVEVTMLCMWKLTMYQMILVTMMPGFQRRFHYHLLLI